MPLGAHWDGGGTNFSVFSGVAAGVDLCLFDVNGHEERITLPEATAHCWHGYLPGVGPGQRYGFRVDGPWAPLEGHRCNPRKLLLDPYARAIGGVVTWGPAVLPHLMDDPDVQSDEDSAAAVPRSIVIDPEFDWGHDRPRRRHFQDTVIYEVHVKGFTARMPGVPDPLRGTYAGLAHPAAIDYLTRLGVTALELMPVHQFVHDGHLVERGLRNYWGYNSIGYFSPHGEYSHGGTDGGQVREFKAMVKALHAAGLEVILDVVYNHTAEGNHLGPSLSFKGLDNVAYYRTIDADRRHYMDYTGTGNSLNMRHPHTLQLVMDSLRYWALDMHVDGFRFDLASTLARELHDVEKLSSFFDIIHQDPVLNRLKLIAEPWDVGAGGYQVGNFPALWCEWNDKFRDVVRDYWRSQESMLGEFAARVTGSADLYQEDGRAPIASINFITAHDGFTLRDLVSFNDKHNEANGEHNRDGERHNRSWNLGAEGPTDETAINVTRRRQQRNLLATLFLSQGVPMLLGGDETGRTQRGNNNAYCQDNEMSWFDWETVDEDLLRFTTRLIAFQREHPVFRRRRWFKGEACAPGVAADIAWLRADGGEMEASDWEDIHAKCVSLFLNGDRIPASDARGRIIRDESFCLLFNAQQDSTPFSVPGPPWGDGWTVVLDTASEQPFSEEPPVVSAHETIDRPGLSLLVLQRTAPRSGRAR